MQTVPKKWSEIFAGDHRVEFKAVIAGNTYTYAQIKSASVQKSMMDKLGIGQAVSAQLDMVFEPVGTIPVASGVECFIRLKNNDPLEVIVDESGDLLQTDDGFVLAASYTETTDWLPFGTFYIDTRETDVHGWMTITAYDRMLAAEREFPSTAGSMTMTASVTYIAQQLGISVDTRSQIAPFSIDSPVGVYTMREVLCGIAAASGGNFIITESNQLRLVRLASPSGGSYAPVVSYDALGDPVTIGKVTLYPDSDTQYTSGDTGYELQADCVYATQEICNYVLGVLNGVVYRPYSASAAYIDPASEIGDSVNPHGNASILGTVTFTVSNAMAADIEAAIDTEVNHEYPYEARSREERRTASAVSEIKKATEQIALSVNGKVEAAEVQSAIDLNLNSLSLSYKAGTNGASITLSKDGVEISGQVKIGSIDASKIAVTDLNADNIVTGTLTAIDIVGCTIYAQANRKNYASMESDGLYIYTDTAFKAGIYADSDSATLELGNAQPAIIQKRYDGGHMIWIGDKGENTGILINLTKGTVSVYKNGDKTSL